MVIRVCTQSNLLTIPYWWYINESCVCVKSDFKYNFLFYISDKRYTEFDFFIKLLAYFKQ
jgi:hypothetical protein